MTSYSTGGIGDSGPGPHALALDSDLGAAGAEPLRLALMAIVQAVSLEDRPGPVLIEAAAVDRVGTGALQALLAAALKLQELGRQLVLVSPSSSLRECCRIAGAEYMLRPAGSGPASQEEGEV